MTDERIQNSQKDEPLLNKYTSQIVPSYYFIITKQKNGGMPHSMPPVGIFILRVLYCYHFKGKYFPFSRNKES